MLRTVLIAGSLLLTGIATAAGQAAGKRVFVKAQNVSSGDAQTKLAAGRLKLTAWSPSSSMWGGLLNFEADQPYAPETSPSIVRTPLVIAMWEPMAKALGYPKRKIGFADILKLARSNQGWPPSGAPSSASSSSSTRTRTSPPPACLPSSPSTTRRPARRRG